MTLQTPALLGRIVRLDPLERHHIEALAAASSHDPALYRWSYIPQGVPEMTTYVEAALKGRDEGRVIPFAIRRVSDDAVIGSSRFFDLDWWPWPAGHPSHGRKAPDACEIGYTWLARDAIRSGANTEAKHLMLAYAFETWQVVRVCFHTDSRNERSRAALARIGGQFEGILRGHRMAADFIPRDSVRFSIIAADWPATKHRLEHLLNPR